MRFGVKCRDHRGNGKKLALMIALWVFYSSPIGLFTSFTFVFLGAIIIVTTTRPLIHINNINKSMICHN